MASFVTLDDVSFGDEEIDAAFRRWREAIEQAKGGFPKRVTPRSSHSALSIEVAALAA